LAADYCPLDSTPPVLNVPVVRYGTASILVILTSVKRPSETETCQTPEPVAVTIRFDEPIGTRVLLDGLIWPGRDARVPMAAEAKDWLVPLTPHPT
jgi:hypothetical protein